MNPSEQRLHRTKTAALEGDIETLEALLKETARRVKIAEAKEDVLQRRLDAHATRVLSVEGRMAACERQWDRTLFERLKWLITGR